MTPLVSVVMPVYNGEVFLAEAIESILGQSLRDFELVAIDDGSTDGTANLLENAAKADSRIRLVRQANRGVVAALNIGISASSGAWIARMDADDVALPERLQRQVALVAREPGIAAVGGDCTVIDEDGRPLSTRRFPRTCQGAVKALERGGLPFPHPTALIRRGALEQVGGYRERFRHAEDIDLWLRLSEVGAIRSIGQVVLLLRKHASNVSAFGGGRLQLRNAFAARICHFRRARGLSDPASLPDEEWDAFLAWLDARLDGVTRDEELIRELMGARERGWRVTDARLLLNARAPGAALTYLRKKACWDRSAERLALESRTVCP